MTGERPPLLRHLGKLASHSAVYGLADVFTTVVNLLLIPLYTTYLGATEYGHNISPGKGLASGSDGILYLGSLDKIYAINTTVGANFGEATIPGVTLDVAGLGQIRGLASEVPEPATMALVGFGLCALGFARRRR